MKNVFSRFILLLAALFLFSLTLTACGGDEPEPAPATTDDDDDGDRDEEPADEEEPTEEPEPTETLDVTADFDQTSSEVLGVTIGHPADWVVEVGESGDIEIASAADAMQDEFEGDGALVAVTSLDFEMLGFMADEDVDTSDPIALLDLFTGLITEGEGDGAEFVVTEEPTAVTVAGMDAARTAYEVTGEDQDGTAIFVAIPQGERVVYVFAAITEGAVDDLQPTVEAMLETVVLTDPVVVEAEPDTEEEMEPETETETETSGEPVNVDVPSVVGGPLLFDGLPEPALEPGSVMYTNGNLVFDIAVQDGIIFGATSGGMVAWDAETYEFLGKWTTLDGILHNVADAVTVCPLPEQRVVLGTRGGLSLYDPATDTWENWTPDNTGMGSSSGIDTLTCVPHLNTLVVGYDLDGVDVYDANTDSWTYYAPFDQLESGFATAIAVKGDLEEIWVAHIAAVSVIRADGTISYYDEENSNLDDPNTDAFEHFVEGIAVDTNGTVWLAQGGGLTRVDGDNQFTFFNSEEIHGWPFWSGADALTAAPDGTLYTNSTFGGVCQFDPATASCLVTYEDEEGMADDFNNTIVVNGDGRIYYGSEGEGISVHDGSGWTNLQVDQLPLANSYRAIAQGADGSIWVGGFFGLQRFSAADADAAWEDLSDQISGSVNTFLPRANGMWVGHTNGASFYEFESDTWTHVERGDEPGQGIYNGEVLSLAQDSRGRIWFGTSAGVTVWDGANFTFYDLLNDDERADERSPRYVYDVLAEGDNVWVGGVSALFRFDANDEMARWDEVNGLPGFVPSVYALAQDADGTVLAAVDGNLLAFNGDNSFDELYESPSSIHDIILDDEGDLVLGTGSSGVILRVAGEYMPLTTAEGLPSNSFMGENVIVDYLGTVWFAASEGGMLRIIP